MKENATHICLIRDKNGKPVEAEYVLLLESITDLSKRDFGYTIIYQFNHWAKLKANRIPVTGDWPTDRDVFAMEEVEPVVLVRSKVDGDKRWYTGTVEQTKQAFTDPKLWERKDAIRLKATLSDDRHSEEEHIVPLRKTIPVKLTVQSEVTVKEGEQPKQLEVVESVRQQMVDEFNKIESGYPKTNTKKFEYWKGFCDCIVAFDNAVLKLKEGDKNGKRN